MKIVRLEAENVKRLRAVEIAPDGSLVVIGGRNGAGKTSVLDAIEMALGGKRAAPPKPVREGEEIARVVCDLGELVVKRTFKPDGRSTLKVETHDGASYKSPQRMLDELVGELSFDPLAFARMQPRERVEMLRALVGVDLEQLDAERRQAYEDRTAVNREAKTLEGQLAGLPEHPDAPEAEVSVAELAEELDAAQAATGKYNAAQQGVRIAERDADEAQAEVDRLRAELAVAEERLESARQQVMRAHAEANAMPAPPDTASIREQMRNAEAINAKVRDNTRRRELLVQLEAMRAESQRLTDAIAAVDERKREAVAAAELPVEGLGFDDAGVTLEGVPFEQASGAEQLRCSVAMGLALNPKLRVLLIRDGSLLDEDSLRLVAEMADEQGAQVWLERVGAGDGGVLIEDGEVRP